MSQFSNGNCWKQKLRFKSKQDLEGEGVTMMACWALLLSPVLGVRGQPVTYPSNMYDPLASSSACSSSTVDCVIVCNHCMNVDTHEHSTGHVYRWVCIIHKFDSRGGSIWTQMELWVSPGCRDGPNLQVFNAHRLQNLWGLSKAHCVFAARLAIMILLSMYISVYLHLLTWIYHKKRAEVELNGDKSRANDVWSICNLEEVALSLPGGNAPSLGEYVVTHG